LQMHDMYYQNGRTTMERKISTIQVNPTMVLPSQL
jgi:hypothetical protein